MRVEQRIHLVVRQVGVQRGLRHRARDDRQPGRAADRGQPDQQQEPGQYQHFSMGVVEVAVQAHDQHQCHRQALPHRRRLGRGPADGEEPEGQDREPCLAAEVQAEQVVTQSQPEDQEARREREGATPLQPVGDGQPAHEGQREQNPDQHLDEPQPPGGHAVVGPEELLDEQQVGPVIVVGDQQRDRDPYQRRHDDPCDCLAQVTNPVGARYGGQAESAEVVARDS